MLSRPRSGAVGRSLAESPKTSDANRDTLCSSFSNPGVSGTECSQQYSVSAREHICPPTAGISIGAAATETNHDHSGVVSQPRASGVLAIEPCITVSNPKSSRVRKFGRLADLVQNPVNQASRVTACSALQALRGADPSEQGVKPAKRTRNETHRTEVTAWQSEKENIAKPLPPASPSASAADCVPESPPLIITQLEVSDSRLCQSSNQGGGPADPEVAELVFSDCLEFETAARGWQSSGITRRVTESQKQDQGGSENGDGQDTVSDDDFAECMDPWDEPAEKFHECGANNGDEIPVAGPSQAPVGEHVEIRAWLEGLGCGAYAGAFSTMEGRLSLLQAELSWPVIALLTDNDLRQLGVSAMGPRRKILAAAALKAQPLDPRRAATSACVGPKAGAALKASCITDFFPTRSGTEVPKPPPLPPPAKWSGRGRPGTQGSKFSDRGKAQEWNRVPGTSFVVDKFGRQVESSVDCRSWFLTHFHADHYGGLNGRFKSGLIYCTQITARLVNARLNVSMNRMRVVELNRPVTVEGVRVTFLDANHCPGAAMVLFEVPGRRPALHCGDCRCHKGMQEEVVLQNLRDGRLDLFLDTTYCSPQYDFPSQQEVLRFVIDALKAEKYNQNKTLFLFGSYTIGKERLFLEAARILQQKVYVSRAKRQVLEALQLPREYTSLLTDNDREAAIQAVPMGMVNLKRMAHIAKHYRSRFTTVVGIRPTGWTHSAERSRASRGRRLQKGSLILYSVPYSEHSSCKELQEFVRWLQPARIIPTVGNEGGPKAAAMVSLLRS